MNEAIESVTRSALGLALDAASLRQQAFAANIANANVGDYQTRRVSFESQLDDARRGLAQNGRLDAASLSQVRPHLELATDASGAAQPVQLDAQAVEMARNAVHYQALVKGLTKHFSILSMAASDGKK